MLRDVILELVDERGLNQSDLTEIIKEGVLAAYNKKYPEAQFRLTLDKDSGLFVEILKTVVSEPDNETTQISLRKARFIKKAAELEDTMWLPFEEPIGRVEILKARQVIATKIRDIEAQSVFKEFEDKIGSIVHGTIHKVERNGISVMIRDTVAFLPKSCCVPEERYIPGRPIRALLKEIKTEYSTNGQLILDRASADFLIALLGIEIPEVYDKLIEIKAASRRAGYKSKIIVASHDPNIDPVGTCVGVGGGRIKPILKELGGEKIDVISWVNSKEELVKNALRPAEVNRVEILDDKNARAWVSDDQRAYAIGKSGQNIGLASELLQMHIELVGSGTTDISEFVHTASDSQDDI